VKTSEKKKGKEKVTSVEVLNLTSVEAAAVSQPNADSIDDDDHLEGLPEVTPSLQEFSKLPLWDFERSFQFIQQHRDVYVPGAPDALFLAAYTAQNEGKPKYAKQCIHQSLLLQYCEKLGNDGVGVFFKKYGLVNQASPG
jgi:cell division cycle protein 37